MRGSRRCLNPSLPSAGVEISFGRRTEDAAVGLNRLYDSAGFVEAQEKKGTRKKLKSLALARSVDFLIMEMGIRRILRSQAVEILVRRLWALLVADASNS